MSEPSFPVAAATASSSAAHERPTPIAPEQVRLRWTETGPRLLRQGADEVPVRIMWARPLTARGEELSLVDEKRRELAFIPSLAALVPEARAIAERALGERYLVPRIARVLETHIHLGTRYWRVETEIGERRFAMREPRKNVHWLVPRERALIKDTMGNRYEIVSLTGLDERSRAAVDKVM